MGFLEFIFGTKKKEVSVFLKKEALILDVRAKKEYNKGHISNSIHIPISDLHNNIEKLKTYKKPFVVCCESGVRSSKGTRILKRNKIEATNGGGWKNLKKEL